MRGVVRTGWVGACVEVLVGAVIGGFAVVGMFWVWWWAVVRAWVAHSLQCVGYGGESDWGTLRLAPGTRRGGMW